MFLMGYFSEVSIGWAILLAIPVHYQI